MRVLVRLLNDEEDSILKRRKLLDLFIRSLPLCRSHTSTHSSNFVHYPSILIHESVTLSLLDTTHSSTSIHLTLVPTSSPVLVLFILQAVRIPTNHA